RDREIYGRQQGDQSANQSETSLLGQAESYAQSLARASTVTWQHHVRAARSRGAAGVPSGRGRRMGLAGWGRGGGSSTTPIATPSVSGARHSKGLLKINVTDDNSVGNVGAGLFDIAMSPLESHTQQVEGIMHLEAKIQEGQQVYAHCQRWAWANEQAQKWGTGRPTKAGDEVTVEPGQGDMDGSIRGIATPVANIGNGMAAGVGSAGQKDLRWRSARSLSQGTESVLTPSRVDVPGPMREGRLSSGSATSASIGQGGVGQKNSSRFFPPLLRGAGATGSSTVPSASTASVVEAVTTSVVVTTTRSPPSTTTSGARKETASSATGASNAVPGKVEVPHVEDPSAIPTDILSVLWKHSRLHYTYNMPLTVIPPRTAPVTGPDTCGDHEEFCPPPQESPHTTGGGTDNAGNGNARFRDRSGAIAVPPRRAGLGAKLKKLPPEGLEPVTRGSPAALLPARVKEDSLQAVLHQPQPIRPTITKLFNSHQHGMAASATTSRQSKPRATGCVKYTSRHVMQAVSPIGGGGSGSSVSSRSGSTAADGAGRVECISRGKATGVGDVPAAAKTETDGASSAGVAGVEDGPLRKVNPQAIASRRQAVGLNEEELLPTLVGVEVTSGIEMSMSTSMSASTSGSADVVTSVSQGMIQAQSTLGLGQGGGGWPRSLGLENVRAKSGLNLRVMGSQVPVRRFSLGQVEGVPEAHCGRTRSSTEEEQREEDRDSEGLVIELERDGLLGTEFVRDDRGDGWDRNVPAGKEAGGSPDAGGPTGPGGASVLLNKERQADELQRQALSVLARQFVAAYKECLCEEGLGFQPVTFVPTVEPAGPHISPLNHRSNGTATGQSDVGGGGSSGGGSGGDIGRGTRGNTLMSEDEGTNTASLSMHPPGTGFWRSLDTPRGEVEGRGICMGRLDNDESEAYGEVGKNLVSDDLGRGIASTVHDGRQGSGSRDDKDNQPPSTSSALLRLALPLTNTVLLLEVKAAVEEVQQAPRYVECPCPEGTRRIQASVRVWSIDVDEGGSGGSGGDGGSVSAEAAALMVGLPTCHSFQWRLGQWGVPAPKRRSRWMGFQLPEEIGRLLSRLHFHTFAQDFMLEKVEHALLSTPSATGTPLDNLSNDPLGPSAYNVLWDMAEASTKPACPQANPAVIRVYTENHVSLDCLWYMWTNASFYGLKAYPTGARGRPELVGTIDGHLQGRESEEEFAAGTFLLTTAPEGDERNRQQSGDGGGSWAGTSPHGFRDRNAAASHRVMVFVLASQVTASGNACLAGSVHDPTRDRRGGGGEGIPEDLAHGAPIRSSGNLGSNSRGLAGDPAHPGAFREGRPTTIVGREPLENVAGQVQRLVQDLVAGAMAQHEEYVTFSRIRSATEQTLARLTPSPAPYSPEVATDRGGGERAPPSLDPDAAALSGEDTADPFVAAPVVGRVTGAAAVSTLARVVGAPPEISIPPPRDLAAARQAEQEQRYARGELDELRHLLSLACHIPLEHIDGKVGELLKSGRGLDW
ncbi:unnamed protein product, partial [Discosporangium mesarthrocarpum]